MLKVNEAKELKIILLDDSGDPIAGTVSYVVYDENDASFATGNMTVVAGVTGLYTMTFTPDAAGIWSVIFNCTDPNRTGVKCFDVGMGVEQDTYDAVIALNNITAANVWAVATRTLTDPNSYKADVSALALETSLTAIKGGGWTTETLRAIFDAIASLNDIAAADVWSVASRTLSTPNDYKANVSALALETTVAALNDLAQSDILDDATPFSGADIATILSAIQHGTYGLSALETLVDEIESRIGTNSDVGNMADTIFAGQQAIYHNTHHHYAMIVADKTSLTADETAIKTNIEGAHNVYLVDEDDVDSGNFDFDVVAGIFISSSCTDMTKLNELTTVAVPMVTDNPEVALTIFRIGDDSGGAGTSWGTSVAQTQINIVDNSHEITLTLSTGNLTIYSAGQTINWLRASDLVGGGIELAEVSGDNTKTTMAVLTYDVTDEDGNPAPAIRVFLGALNNYADLDATGLSIFASAEMWILHQGIREIEVQGLGKLNQILQKLGGELSNADNLYDYIVTGANEAGAFPVITGSATGSVLERLEYVSDLLVHGTYGLSALETLIDEVESLLKDATHGLAALETLVDGIETKTNNLPADPASQARIISKLDFWSEPEDVTIEDGADFDSANLPDIIVPTLPTGITIYRVELLFKCALIRSTGGDNAIDEAGIIRLKKDGDAAFDANGIDAYNIPIGLWAVDDDIAAERGGDAFVGTIDIKSKVDGADTYETRFDSVSATAADLVLVDACVGLRIYFY